MPDAHLPPRAVTGRNASLATAAVLAAGLFAFSFVAGPASCAWGWTAYTWSGLAVVLSMTAVPFVLRSSEILKWRVLASMLFGVVGLGVWVAGVFAGGLRILCRLF